MRELLPQIDQWTTAEKPFAIVRVIQTWGSSPRPVGSAMLVSPDMEIAGSVSGGCVEGAVVKAALPILESGESQRLAFGVAHEDAWAVGLSCGGKMQVFAERFLAYNEDEKEQAVWQELQSRLHQNKGCVLITALQDGPARHTLILPDGSSLGYDVADSVKEAGMQSYRERRHQVFEQENEAWFVQVFARKSQLLIIGAAHITTELVRLGNLYDFETVVTDPRGVFSEKTQFPVAPDAIFTEYPAEILPKYDLDAYTFAVILSHDPKIDDNALEILLRSEVAYIGALGSKKTHAKRINRLTRAGFTEEELTRIHAPIGVSINAKRPKEIALSIMAQIIEVQNSFR